MSSMFCIIFGLNRELLLYTTQVLLPSCWSQLCPRPRERLKPTRIEDAYAGQVVYELPVLKGQSHEIFYSRFFSWIIFYKAHDNSLSAVSNFSKIREDIRNSSCTAGVNDTASKLSTGVVESGGKVTAGFNDTAWCTFSKFALIAVTHEKNPEAKNLLVLFL